MDSDDDFDHAFFSAVDQLVAQHKSGVSRGCFGPRIALFTSLG